MSWKPFLTMWLVTLFTGWLSDYAVKNGICTVTVRKICNTIGFWGPAIALACLVNVEDRILNTIFIIAMGLYGTSVCGFKINHIDLSPKYAGFLMSISNFFASVINLIVFYTSSYIAILEVIIFLSNINSNINII
jgi:ACS family sodium-dependent inorganic phosphate cotransporter